MSDVNLPCTSCNDDTAIMLFIKRALILVLCFIFYCLLLCCFTCSAVRRQQTAAEVEISSKDDNIRNQILAIIFPGQQRGGETRTVNVDEECQSSNETDDHGEDEHCCSICLDKFDPEDLVTMSACSHEFHRDCLLLWAKTKDGCPYCRQPLWDQATYDSTKKEILDLAMHKDSSDNTQSERSNDESHTRTEA
ncbi:zinc-RING finger domain [Fragilaria crotonensis]|nr:zinc-RING finger domain [Fragilaria crotonensis]KAI2505466.1 zinc-RING finger domain [Fragilaria crotonensis]